MRMIGRLSALKASSFVDIDSKEIQKYGLDNPHLTWNLKNEVGKKCCTVGWKQIQRRITLLLDPGDSTVYVAKSQLLQDFVFERSNFEKQKIFQRKDDWGG